MTVWILLLFVGVSHGVYYGSVLNYYPRKYAGPSGTHLVEIYSEVTTDNCSVAQLRCLIVNCTQVSTVIEKVDTNSDSFCQTGTTTVFQVSTDTPFQISLDAGSESWVHNEENVTLIRALSVVDLRNGSYNRQGNYPPQATIMSPVRIPSNCARQMPLLAFDPDYDEIRCRFASKAPYECDPCSPSSLSPSLTLTPTCVLRWFPLTSPTPGLYVIDLVIEDYPRNFVTLFSSNGRQETKNSNDSISQVPLQFVFNMTSSVPSCTEGEYVPKFVDPTPEHGTHFYVTPGDSVQIVIQAEATAATVESLLFSGPANVTKDSEGNGRFVLTWTSSTDFTGRTSEIRCVILHNVYNDYLYNFFAPMMTYYPSVTNGSVMVTFRVKFLRPYCFTVPDYVSKLFDCIGDCGNWTVLGFFRVDSENNGACQMEMVIYLKSSSLSPFQLTFGGYPMLTDLRIRSDTGLPNRPPISTYPPVIRLLTNCAREYKILFFDEDGDDVRHCSGLDDYCTPCSSITSYGTSFCTYVYPSYLSYYGYVKDFPRKNITLTSTNGSQEARTPDDAFGESIFIAPVLYFEDVPSCTEGVYIPKFTSGTPEFGEILNATVGEALLIEVGAEANTSKVSELLFSGPHEMEELSVGEGQFQLQWTPTEAEVGQSHVVCFLVEAMVKVKKYQSETRCVVVKVAPRNASAQPSTTAPPTMTSSPPDEEGNSYVVVLKAKLTSLKLLTDSDVEDVSKQLKGFLVGLGLPPETTVALLNVSSTG